MSNDVKQTAAEEAAQIDLQLKKQQLRKAQLENDQLDHQIKTLENQKEAAAAQGISRGVALAASNADELKAFTVCNHKKGGDERTYPQGDGRDGYALLRHRLPNGDLFIRCLRCGKEWLPPIQPQPGDSIYQAKGKFDEVAFKHDVDVFKLKLLDYKTAVAYPCGNKDSAAPLFGFKDKRASQLAFRGTNPPEKEQDGQ